MEIVPFRFVNDRDNPLRCRDAVDFDLHQVQQGIIVAVRIAVNIAKLWEMLRQNMTTANRTRTTGEYNKT